MKRVFSLLAGLACMLAIVFGSSSAAWATSITFDFEGLADGTAGPGVGTYMSGLYPGQVIDTDGRVEDGVSHPWISPTASGASGNYLRPTSSGDFEIHFVDVPIYSVQLDLAVFDDGTGGVFDFNLYAYDSTFADAGGTKEDPNPAALISLNTWSDTGPFDMNSGLITYSSAVSLLVFSDSGARDVGVDNLTVSTTPVSAIPEPTGVLCFAVGLALIRRALGRRRHA